MPGYRPGPGTSVVSPVLQGSRHVLLITPELDFAMEGSDPEVESRLAESDPESSDAGEGRLVRVRARSRKPVRQRRVSHASYIYFRARCARKMR